MAVVQNQSEKFEAYFKRADLDGDGRISGAEAVGFFQGANLPKNVLAQIWAHADKAHTGFLGRQEFYNALKLVTVAQSKRELTPDIVNAALYGPAASKIPPPQINLAATPTPTNQMSSVPAVSAPHMGAVGLAVPQNPGLRGPGISNVSMNPTYAPQQSPSVRPPVGMPSGPRPNQGFASPNFSAGGVMVSQSQGTPSGFVSRPPQVTPPATASPTVTNPNLSNDWLSGRTATGPTNLRGVSPSTASMPQTPVLPSSQPIVNDSKALVVSGNGPATAGSGFGGDAFSAIQASSKWQPSGPAQSATVSPAGGTTYSASTTQPSVKPNSLDSLQNTFSMPPAGSQLPRTQSMQNPSQQVSAQSSSSFTTSGSPAGAGISTPNNSQPSWPKMKPSDVQKYTKVFMEVDTDRDGRITGEQARNLFLSWRLPREVLKQVWDLSDQDNDSMLSLREFCFALYLMERFREGRPLPASLPSNVMYDETLLSMTGQSNVNYGNAWGSNPGFGQTRGMGPPSMTPAGLRPPVPVTAPTFDGATIPNLQKPRATVLGDSFTNPVYNGEQNDSNLQDAAADERKVEKVILDSKEKLEFYRDKMQELVLYKSRCDNRLNEITERAIADKRESEALGKKYEEKYKQVAEIASKLTIEEAKFREIQERKSELHQAIVKMEQGGSADGILQVRSDRIQSDLEELMKVLTERCKKHGINIKTAAVIELPVGWQPGIQEGAAVWDEEWDKFEDEGFGNELKFDAKNAPMSPNSESGQGEKPSPDGSVTPDSLFHADEKPEHFTSPASRALESESAFTHSDDEYARSPRGSSAAGTPSKQFSDSHFEKSPEADAETHRSFDESTWGAFDNNDDVDSVWGFNANTKDSDFDKHKDFFGTSDFGINSTRSDSPSAESAIFQKKSGFAFDDSVPSTPMSKFGSYSPRYSEAGDHYSFSRFDSFSSMHDSGFSPQPEKLSRFDSVNSSKDYGRFSFDDSDPFGSSGAFKVSSSESEKKSSDKWSAF